MKTTIDQIRALLDELETELPAERVPVYHLLPIDGWDFDESADGVSIRVSWYDVGRLEALVPKVRDAGKPFMLRLMAGRRSELTTVEDMVAVEHRGEVFSVPRPSEAHIARLTDAAGQMARGYPDAVAIHCSGWLASSECVRVPEFDKHPVEYYTRQAEAIQAAGVLPVFNLAPPGGKPWVAKLLEYARDNGVVVQSNALGAQADGLMEWVSQIVEAPRSAWQALCPVGNQDRFNPYGLKDEGLTKALKIALAADPLWLEWYSPRGQGQIAKVQKYLEAM